MLLGMGCFMDRKELSKSGVEVANEWRSGGEVLAEGRCRMNYGTREWRSGGCRSETIHGGFLEYTLQTNPTLLHPLHTLEGLHPLHPYTP